MTKRHLIIATRESPLALAQAESIKQALLKNHPHLSIDLLGITTQADRQLNVSLLDIGGKGLFVKELEEALLDGRADIAVHSMKDVPMELPPGLIIPVIGKREDPRDAFVSDKYYSLAELPCAASIGTSSLRRQTQLAALRPDLTLNSLRGNIQTRLRRLDEGQFDAIILAAAGLLRMKMASRIRTYLSLEESLPAAAQGALGIECREEDKATQALIASLNDEQTQLCVAAVRFVAV
jgi:hydroxymethylbilane synthase